MSENGSKIGIHGRPQGSYEYKLKTNPEGSKQFAAWTEKTMLAHRLVPRAPQPDPDGTIFISGTCSYRTAQELNVGPFNVEIYSRKPKP